MPHSGEIYAMHPFGKVPCFKHGDVMLCETVAIGTYVDDVFDGPALVPADTVARAHMHKWISLYNDNVASAMGPNLVVQRLVRPMMGEETDEAQIKESLPKIRKCLEIYDGALAGKDWLIADTISLADLFAIPMFAFLPIVPEGDELLKGLPNLGRWCNSVATRDSFKNTVADMDQFKKALS